MTNMPSNPRQALYDAAARWADDDWPAETGNLVDTAAECLAGDLDSPHLRMLAGADRSARADEISPLLDAAFDELGIPQPGTLKSWQWVAAGGGTCSRPPLDIIRLDIRPARGPVSGHEVLIYVNGAEMTEAGAGMGMDPFSILIPVNRLAAGPEPRQVPVARCDCGTYGCGSTDTIIVRDGDSVHWEWALQTPMSRGVTFLASQYDAEVARLEADRSWERLQDTVARHVLHAIDDDALAQLGVKVSWANKDYFRDDQFLVAMQTIREHPDDPLYQVFLRVPWLGRRPEDVAGHITGIVSRPPQEWPVTYHCTTTAVTAPPPMAGPRWSREQVPHPSVRRSRRTTGRA